MSKSPFTVEVIHVKLHMFVFSETYWVEKLKADNKDYYEDD
jgi:hypothetical protein